MTKLSINVNKVALLRNQRHVGYPDVVKASESVIAAGAHGITVHPRPDERHIRAHDVYDLAEMLKDHPTIEYNIEGNPFQNFMKFCRDTRPHQATLVPDAPGVATSDTGWDVFADEERLRPVIKELKDLGCRVVLFMNPLPEAMAKVAEVGADRIELYTGPYSDGFTEGNGEAMADLYARSAQAALDAGLGVNAGHDLTTENLPLFKSRLPQLDEVSIGHAVIADALWKGFDQTVKDFLKALAS